jgi:hypothetical protein
MITCKGKLLFCVGKSQPIIAAILPYLALVAPLGDFLKKLAQPPEEIRAEALHHWSSHIPGVTPIVELEERKRLKIAGVIQSIRIDPREGHGSIEATIIDGTGELMVRWLGRPSKSGIRLGMGLVVEGTVGRDRNGGMQVLNPEYELIVGPEHG